MANYLADEQVIKGLLDWLNEKLPFKDFGVKKINLEKLDAKKSMGLFAETGSFKDVINIIGDWECNFRFRIDFKGDGDSTDDVLKLSKPLNYIARFFEEQTIAKLPDLDIGTGRTPVRIEMVTLPSKIAVNSDNTQIFSAFYNLNLLEKRKK